MSRKRSPEEQERRDRRRGFALAPIVNVLFYAFLAFLFASDYGNSYSDYQMLRWWHDVSPWLVNGGLLLLLFIFRPHMAVGYLLAPFILSMLAIGGSVLFITSCLAGVTVIWVPVVGPIFALLVGGWVALKGLRWGGRLVLDWWNNWLSGTVPEQAQPVSHTQQAADAELLKKLKRDELEIGDDGELHPGKRSRRDP